MRIDETRIRRLAALARVRLEEEELPRLVEELNGVLEHLDPLAGIGPAVPGGADNGPPREATRPDEPRAGPERADPGTLAPHWREPYVLAPRNPALDRGGER